MTSAEPPAGPPRLRMLAPVCAGLAMLVFGVVWMLLWLIGLNGFDGYTGGLLLLAQTAIAGVAVPASAAVAYSLDARMCRRGMNAAASSVLAVGAAVAVSGTGVVVLATLAVLVGGSS